MNSTALFSDAMPDKEMNRLAKIKSKHPEKYEKEFKKANEEWDERLKNLPYHKREVIGDASETALVKFYQPFQDILECRESYKVAK